MSTTFESLMMVEGAEAEQILAQIRDRGPSAVIADLSERCDPGSGTLISVRQAPWHTSEYVYEVGDFVMYCDSAVPSVGLACVVEVPVAQTG